MWTGSTFGIAWDDARDGMFRIFFVQLSAAGSKIGTEVALTPSTSNARSADLLWTGSTYAAAWSDNRDGGSKIFYQSVGSDGAPIGVSVPLTNVGSGGAFEPDLVQSSAETQAVWHDARDGDLEIYFQVSVP